MSMTSGSGLTRYLLNAYGVCARGGCLRSTTEVSGAGQEAQEPGKWCGASDDGSSKEGREGNVGAKRGVVIARIPGGHSLKLGRHG